MGYHARPLFSTPGHHGGGIQRIVFTENTEENTKILERLNFSEFIRFPMITVFVRPLA